MITSQIAKHFPLTTLSHPVCITGYLFIYLFAYFALLTL